MRTVECVGLLDESGDLMRVSECNLQIEGSDFDGPVLWGDMETAVSTCNDTGGVPDGHRLVAVTVIVDDTIMTFGELVKEGNSLGFEYECSDSSREPFVIYDRHTGKKWTRETPGGCQALLRNLIKSRKIGKL